MADVEMPDAGPSSLAPSKATGAVKSSKSGAQADSGAEGKKRFEVKKVIRTCLVLTPKSPLIGCVQWNAVALWAWDIVVDNCAICRNHIMDLCTDLTTIQA
jgi:hypothetical protein